MEGMKPSLRTDGTDRRRLCGEGERSLVWFGLDATDEEDKREKTRSVFMIYVKPVTEHNHGK